MKDLDYCKTMDEIAQYIIDVLSISHLEKHNWTSEALEVLEMAKEKLKQR
jgi:hypothetical protein